MKKFFNFFKRPSLFVRRKKIYPVFHGDKSKHRQNSFLYEDLCM